VIDSPENTYRGEVVPFYPAPLADTPENALYTAAAQLRDRRNLAAGLPRMASLMDRHRPAQAGFYAELAQGYRAAGDLSKAIPMYETAAQKEPTAYRQLQLGNALMEAQQYAQAETVLRRVTGIAPDDGAAWGTLGWVLWQQQKGAEARA